MPPTPPQGFRYITIDDFSPGIVHHSGQALPGVALPAKLGSAQADKTYRCIALPNGGLGPLPKRTETFSLASAPEGTAPASGYWIVGFFSHGPMSVGIGGLSRYNDQLFVGIAYRPNASTQQRLRLLRHQIFAAASGPYSLDTLKSINSGYTGNNFYDTMWFAQSRMNRSNPLSAGNPIIGVAWATPAGVNEKFISAFPDPSAAGTTGMYDLSTSRSGQLYGHQGRLVLNETATYLLGAVGGSYTEEQISFTDPPNSGGLGTQSEVFSQEFPGGIGAFGSISAGELLLIKRSGGGVLISGDVANPDQVVRLPGVASTGAAVTNRTASTPVGLLYAVKNGGLWLWRGSDTSEKASAQLEDNAFEYAAAPPRFETSGNTTQPIVSCEAWGEWALATNNWLFDTKSGAWWRIEDPSVANCMYWSRSWSNQFLYGAKGQFTQADLSYAYAFDRMVPASSWSWQSHPIPESTERIIEVREVVLVVQGAGTVTVTCTALDGSSKAETFTFNSVNQPVRLRKTTSCVGYNVVVRIESDGGSGIAPVVYAPLALQVKERQRAVDV